MPENHNPLPPLTLTAAVTAAAAMNTTNGVEEDHFERLPDALILEIFRKVSHSKYLLRCFAVRKRFASLIPHTNTVVWSVASSSPPSIIDHYAPISVMFNVMKFTWVRSLRIEFFLNYSDYDPWMEFRTVIGARFKIAVFISGRVFHKIQGFNNDAAALLTTIIGPSYDNDVKEEALTLTKNLLQAALKQHRIAQILTSGLPALCELVISNKGAAKLCMGKEEIAELRNKNVDQAESELSMSEVNVIGGDGVVGVKFWHGPALLELPSSGRVMESAMVAVIKPEGEEIVMERDVGCILGAFGRDNEDDDYKEHGKVFDEMVHIMKQKIVANHNQDEASFQTYHRLQVFED